MNVIQTILDYNKSKESGGKTDITKSDIISALGYTPISELEKGANSGIAELDDNGKVLTSELPSYVDDVEEFNNLAELQKHTGEASKIYITLDDNKCYRWGGTAYVEISSSITLGETSGTAFRGDLGKEAYDKSHTHSNKEVIDNIASEDITNWNNKSDFDGKYTSLTDTPTIPTVTNDLTNELKANYDLASTQTHTHSNKELLDKLSLNKDNKLLYNGDKVDSDVDLTAIIDDSTIADKTTWSSNKINTAIPKTWVGTKADYEQIKDTLENGTIVYITDDESVILLDKTEITKMKLTDEEFKRQINTLYDINNGSTLSIETDSDTAYQKTVPTGAKLMSIKSIGGKNLVFNQLADVTDIIDETFDFYYNETLFNSNRPKWAKGHKYLFEFYVKSSIEPFTISIGYSNKESVAYNLDGASFSGAFGGRKLLLFTPDDSAIDNGYQYIGLRPVRFETQQHCIISVKNLMIFDLTLMFGAGNEPSTVVEFEKMFPADYYPYNAGEIVSAGTEEVVEQGRNLWDEVWENGAINYNTGIDVENINVIRSKNYISVLPNSTYLFAVTTNYGAHVKARFYDWNKKYIGGNDKNGNTVYPNHSFVTPSNAIYIRFEMPPEYGNVYKNDIALIAGSSGSYTPYHQTGYHIPEAIRNLPGYGWSAGTAKNYIDYENKKYYKCVDSMDLGAVRWQVETSPTFGTYFSTFVDSRKFKRIGDFTRKRHNILCDKYLTVKRDVKEYVDKTILLDGTVSVVTQIQVKDTAYTDAAAFKQAMQGVILYYELANPIVTDISNLIPDDFLRNIEVEADGSITFKNSNDNYHISVPSELSYIVKYNSNASKEYVDSELAKKANKTDIPTKLPANGGNADTVNNHTVLSDVPTNAKFTDTITSIEDSSTTSTTSTWSAQKINDTITNSKNARVILSTGRNVEEAETKTAELVSLDGAYLYWSSQAGANNYVFGIILYVYNKWIMIPIAQSSEDASTGVSFSITDNTITMTKHNTGSTPTAGGVFALGPTLI